MFSNRKFTLSTFLLLGSMNIEAQDSIPKSKWFTLHAQETTVSQYRPSFHANYNGPHSQVAENEWGTTITSTIFAGVKLWKYASAYLNPEIAGGHGLSSAFGIAAFPNGEAFRVGNPDPVFYLARGFFRQLIPLSSEKTLQQDGENKIQTYLPKNYLSLTVGKISIADYFDDNSYSHNPRTQFLSWGLMSNGAWDYPANTRGYTPSAMIEFVNEKFEARYAISMMPTTANGNIMDNHISKANANSLELKYKYSLNGNAGKISLIGFYNTAFMGSYQAPNTITTIDTSKGLNISTVNYSILNSREYGRSKYGYGINIEQNITKNIGMFARASYNDGKNETWCFTEIDQAASIGISLNGSMWKRSNDVFGAAYCISGLSNEHKNYLAKGGLGFILGDGKLNYANEHVFESYYSLSLLNNKITPSLCYQLVLNPAYNKDRGPINIYTIRLHFSI